MRKFVLAVAALLAINAAPAAAQEPAAIAGLNPQTGEIAIPAAQATLDLGEDYVFYGPEDARRILTETWGNPPESADGVLGLVMQADTPPQSDSWGAVVTFQPTGYVSDSDARDADYAALLAQMQAASSAANAQRRAAGFPAVEVAGWAQLPRYDSVAHSVVWARELRFEGEDVHALNYDLRTLGRSGVLSINLVATMPELREMREVADDFAQMAAFVPGARYDDFNADTDDAAGYGIAGLVAGGAGLAVAKKIGVMAVLLKFLKPVLFGLVLLLAAFARPIRRKLGFGKARENSSPAEGGA